MSTVSSLVMYVVCTDFLRNRLVGKLKVTRIWLVIGCRRGSLSEQEVAENSCCLPANRS